MLTLQEVLEPNTDNCVLPTLQGHIYQPHLEQTYVTSTFYTPDLVDKMVNLWKCAHDAGKDRACRIIIATTKDNSSVMVESLFNEKSELKKHKHWEKKNYGSFLTVDTASVEEIHKHFWGPEIATIVRNHPHQSAQGILETCRYVR